MKHIIVTKESETGLDEEFKDLSTGKTYRRDELVKKIDKNYGGIWKGFETRTRDDGLTYIATTKDNPNKLG